MNRDGGAVTRCKPLCRWAFGRWRAPHAGTPCAGKASRLAKAPSGRVGSRCGPCVSTCAPGERSRHDTSGTVLARGFPPSGTGASAGAGVGDRLVPAGPAAHAVAAHRTGLAGHRTVLPRAIGGSWLAAAGPVEYQILRSDGGRHLDRRRDRRPLGRLCCAAAQEGGQVPSSDGDLLREFQGSSRVNGSQVPSSSSEPFGLSLSLIRRISPTARLQPVLAFGLNDDAADVFVGLIYTRDIRQADPNKPREDKPQENRQAAGGERR